MTQGRLGRLVGYGRSMICEIEAGKVMPASGKVPQVADALGATVADLYEGVR
jgi:hypothetical protein